MAQLRKKRSRPPPRPGSPSPILPAPPAEIPPWWASAACVALTAMIWAVFGQTFHHDFITFDDGDYVFDNPMVVHGLTWKGFVWAFTSTHAANWHLGRAWTI